jgi:DNA-binding XRE family transcriptional regulator
MGGVSFPPGANQGFALSSRGRVRRPSHILNPQLLTIARVGLNQAQIHRYEKGAAEPSMSALKRLAQVLGVTTDELIVEEHERGPDDELSAR